MASGILSQLNILVKPYDAKNNDSPVIHHRPVMATIRVLQRTVFHWSGEIDTSKRSVLYQE